MAAILGKRGVNPMFVTQWMEENLRRRVAFNCGHEQVLLWGMPSPEDVKDIADRLKFVSAAVIEFLRLGRSASSALCVGMS